MKAKTEHKRIDTPVTICVSMSAALARKLVKLAKGSELSVSAYIRQIVIEKIKEGVK